jgi:hypothetical protein
MPHQIYGDVEEIEVQREKSGLVTSSQLRVGVGVRVTRKFWVG